MITDAEHNESEKSFNTCYDMYWKEDVKMYGERAAARRMFMNGGYAYLHMADKRKDGRDGKF
jgi:hypothetical protein